MRKWYVFIRTDDRERCVAVQVAYVKPSDFVIRAKFTEVSKKQQYFFTFVFSESDNEHELFVSFSISRLVSSNSSSAVLLRKIKDYIDLSIIERTRKGVASVYCIHLVIKNAHYSASRVHLHMLI